MKILKILSIALLSILFVTCNQDNGHEGCNHEHDHDHSIEKHQGHNHEKKEKHEHGEDCKGH